MDRVRAFGGVIKQRYSKPCCIKVGVGVGVGVLVVVVVVVAASVAAGSGGSGSGGVSDHSEPSTSKIAAETESVTQAPKPTKMENSFLVKLESDNFHQLLAVDDVRQAYVIEMDSSKFFNLYIIADFKQRQHLYVGVEKTVNQLRTDVVETSVLFCHNSPFDDTFNGEFMSATRLRAGGKTYVEQVSGRAVTVQVSDAGVYTMSTVLATIFNESCKALRETRYLNWTAPLSRCGNDTTLAYDTPACPGAACPTFPTSVLSTSAACKKFRQCNYYMGKCDNYWSAATYDRRPYCACRSAILADLDNVNCPATPNDGGECEIPKRDIVDTEAFSACYCKYQIFRIYPVAYPNQAARSVSWVVNAIFTTAPARNYKQCPC